MAHLDADERMARRAAALLSFGETVALGIGLPTRVANFVPPSRRITFFAENGVAGIGPRPGPADEDADVINAGGEPITLLPHGTYFDSATAFAAVRGGRLSTAVLGALQVSERGDLASWKIPGRFSPGMGGGMELAQKARRTIVLTRHVTRAGEPKLVQACTIPLTALAAVSVIVTDMALLEVRDGELLLREVAAGVSVDEVLARTTAATRVAARVGVMEQSMARGAGPGEAPQASGGEGRGGGSAGGTGGSAGGSGGRKEGAS